MIDSIGNIGSEQSSRVLHKSMTLPWLLDCTFCRFFGGYAKFILMFSKNALRCDFDVFLGRIPAYFKNITTLTFSMTTI